MEANAHSPLLSRYALMATYWPAYPTALVTDLASAFNVYEGNHVDLGCGVGHLTYPFTRYAKRVIGLDNDIDSITYARTRDEIPTGALSKPMWVVADAEYCPIEDSAIRLVTLGRSFHHMDQEKVLDRAYAMVQVGGGIAIVNDETIAPFQNDLLWHHAIRDTLREFGVGLLHNDMDLFSLSESHKRSLNASAFINYSVRTYKRRREWDTQSVVGYLETLESLRQLDTATRETLLSTLRTRLFSIEGNGSLREEIEYHVITGVKR